MSHTEASAAGSIAQASTFPGPAAPAPSVTSSNRLMTIATASNNDAPPTNDVVPWETIAAMLTKGHDQRGAPTDFADKKLLDQNKNGACFMLGAVRDPEAGKTKANMTTVEVLTVDADDISEERFLRLLATLAPFEHVWYTTHKNNVDTLKWRVRFVLPLNEARPPSWFLPMWDRLQLLVEGANDSQTRNVNRLNYTPSSPEPARHAFAQWNRGAFLDPLQLPALDGAELPPPASPASRVTNALPASGSDLFAAVSKRMRGRPGDSGKWWRLVFSGAELAEPGARHEIFRSRTFELAKTFSDLPDVVVEQIFAPSRAAMAAVDPTCDTIEQIVEMYRSAAVKVVDGRRQDNKQRAARADEARAAVAGEPALALPPPGVASDSPDGSVEVTNAPLEVYSADEVAAIAAAQKCRPEQLWRRWILYKDGTFWFLGPTGNYSTGHGFQEATIAVYRALGRAPIQLFDVGQTGKTSKKSLNDLATTYGTRVDRIVTRLDLLTSVFEPGDTKANKPSTLYEASTPVRMWAVSPVRHEVIDQWLRILTGTQYEKTLDWLAIFPQLDKAIAALYLCGARGAGKGLLAHGLSKLWTDGGPADPRVVLNDFNEMLTLCPIVFVDETLPQVQTTRDVSGKLREEITTYQRPLKRKYRSESTLSGYVRWIFAANDDNIIRSDGAMSRETIAAIAERFFFVDVPASAREFVVQIGEGERTEWATHKIAEHCLWLACNREVRHGSRMWVDGDVSRMTRELMHANEWASLLCEWLVMYLRDPTRVDQAGSGLVRREAGKLLVNGRAFVEHWATYLGHERTKPSQRRIGEALVTLTNDARHWLQWRGKRVAYREVDLDPIMDWNRKHEALDEGELLASLSTPTTGANANGAGLVMREPGADDGDGGAPF